MQKLVDYGHKIGIELDSVMLSRFEIYMKLVLEWNEKINLTSITDRDEFIVKHFCDCLTVIKSIEAPQGAKIIDIGTGAGFPGIPLLIVRSDIKLTLLDSLNKRLVFINDYVLKELDLKAEVVHGRAEELSKKDEYRENYDIAVSRAVANLSSLTEYCLPFVKVGGKFSSMKGPNVESELESATSAIETLGGKVSGIDSYVLPDSSERNIVLIDKIKNTPQKYPRRGVKISKYPL